MGVPVSSALTVSLLNNPFLNSLTAEDLKSLQSYKALNCHNAYFLWKSDLTLLKTPLKLITFFKILPILFELFGDKDDDDDEGCSGAKCPILIIDGDETSSFFKETKRRG